MCFRKFYTVKVYKLYYLSLIKSAQVAWRTIQGPPWEMGERPSVWGSQIFPITVLITVVPFLSTLYIQDPLKMSYEKLLY